MKSRKNDDHELLDPEKGDEPKSVMGYVITITMLIVFIAAFIILKSANFWYSPEEDVHQILKQRGVPHEHKAGDHR